MSVERQPISGAVGIVGVGLMGGSLGLAARRYAGVEQVRGYSRSRATLSLAVERGAITEACDSLEAACRCVDLVFVATPVRLIPEHVRAALAAAPPHAVVSDMGSTKGGLMAALSEEQQRRFVGGHPLCGSETAGVANATASLYRGATYFLTPGAHVDHRAVERLFAFVRDIGARPVSIDPDEHDRIMALVSHLPHALANTLMTQAGEHRGSRDVLLSGGPSFRDLTRVAGANPRIWADIFLENRAALLASLETFRHGLDELITVLRSSDEERLEEMIRRAAGHRRRMLAASSLPAEELFRIVVRIPDRPGVFRDIFVALGDANINVEDFSMHHESAELGGTLTVYVLGEQVCRRGAAVLGALGYSPVTARESE